MQHTLVLIVYSSASGDNVTLSPRLSPKHGEPVYDPSVKFTTLEGTGINNGTLSYYGVCHNCRSWSGGSVDITSTSQAAIFANGPSGSITNDAGDAPIKYHAEYGAFIMDMTAAAGSAAAPVLGKLSNNTTLSGSKLDGDVKTGKSDTVALIHAVLMIVTFFFLMPLGVLILRVGQSVRWHGINQGLSLLGAVGGSVMGFTTSSSYVRVCPPLHILTSSSNATNMPQSASFSTGHQIIGIAIFAFVLVQFGLGYYHHKIYKRTQQTTKFAPIHVWLGRVILPGAIVDAFLGFPLALDPKFDFILVALVVVLAPTFFVIMYTGSFYCHRQQPGFKLDENPVRSYNMDRM
ncbi:hypothetical protein Sste5346_010191 [Sporothrix stenoceras]|uniref:Cytochrome b561 domain-containing protein n=1 Tax=Sporothrix stenoceras TaxID=5173 RepID=A0ABR3YGZ8_9PEZI